MLKLKGSRSGYIKNGYGKLQSKENYHRQKGTLYNNTRLNPPGRHNNTKYICTNNNASK